MKVMYDLQAFRWARYSGIPRYFSELINQFQQDMSMDISIPCAYCMNRDYQDLFSEMSNSFQWRWKDFIIDTSLKVVKRNPAKYLENINKIAIDHLRQNDYDVFHPTHFDTYFLKHIGSKPFVLTIHDLIIEKYAESYLSHSYDINSVKLLSDNASQIITVSENTKNEFVEYYDIDSDKVTVTYLASPYPKQINVPSCSPVSQKKYLLYVNVRPGHKNFYTMVVAIAKLLLQYDLDLICVGGGEFTDEELVFLRKLRVLNNVKQFTLNNDELRAVYGSAVALIFPSVEEGFGIPVLEAYACGCPVVLSNASCLPEVGGDAAVYFYPKNLKSIADAVERVITDDKLRTMMRENGYKQLEKFSWEKCAAETEKVYERALK